MFTIITSSPIRSILSQKISTPFCLENKDDNDESRTTIDIILPQSASNFISQGKPMILPSLQFTTSLHEKEENEFSIIIYTPQKSLSVILMPKGSFYAYGFETSDCYKKVGSFDKIYILFIKIVLKFIAILYKQYYNIFVYIHSGGLGKGSNWIENQQKWGILHRNSSLLERISILMTPKITITKNERSDLDAGGQVYTQH